MILLQHLHLIQMKTTVQQQKVYHKVLLIMDILDLVEMSLVVLVVLQYVTSEIFGHKKRLTKNLLSTHSMLLQKQDLFLLLVLRKHRKNQKTYNINQYSDSLVQDSSLYQAQLLKKLLFQERFVDQLFSQGSLLPHLPLVQRNHHIISIHVEHHNLALEKHSYTTLISGIQTSQWRFGILIML